MFDKYAVYTKIQSKLQELDLDDLIQIHNELQGINKTEDYCIYDLGMWLDEDITYKKPVEVFRLGIMAKNFCFSDKYVRYNGDGNVETTDNPLEAGWLHISDMVADIMSEIEKAKEPMRKDLVDTRIISLTDVISITVNLKDGTVGLSYD
jgi:hypothetical protein